jgi:hypothetical protein
MSHYRKIETNINDRAALKMALQAMGLEFEDHEVPVHIGQGQLAHVVVKRDTLLNAGFPSYANVGWQFTEDGVQEIADPYPTTIRHNGQTWRGTVQEFLNALRQPYSEARLTRVLEQANDENRVQAGRIASRERQADGSVKIVIQAERNVKTGAGVPARSGGIAARKH